MDRDKLAGLVQSKTIYKHRLLRPGEIRLLQHSPYDVFGSLSFAVKNFREAECPPYLALSYTWGDDAATETIHLNGKPFIIRPNLHRFLRNAVFHIGTGFANGKFVQGEAPDVPANGLIYIWADAICIDQSNVIERNDQVRRMDKIFSQAVSVLCWLGDGHSDSVPHSEVKSSHWPFAQDASLTYESLALMPSYLKCTYWTRTWVVQEFWLARSVVILAPDLCASEKDFLKAYQDWEVDRRKILRAQPSTTVGSGTIAPNAAGASIRPIFAKPFLSRIHSRAHHPLSLVGRLSLAGELFIYRNSSCTDQRDKVFAILGLLDGEQALAIRRYLPNYSLSYKEVFIIALAVMIEYSCIDHKTLAENMKILPQEEWDIKVARCMRKLYPGNDDVNETFLRYGLSKEIQELRGSPSTLPRKRQKIDELSRFVLKKYSPDVLPTEIVKARVENARRKSLSLSSTQ